MKNRIEYFFFLALGFLIKVLGLNASRRFSVIIAFFFFYIVPIRKKTVFENLTNAFPEYSSKQIQEIAFGSYKSFAITLIEILYLPNMSRIEIEGMIDCSNLELVREKYNEKKGLILLSAHFGNWEYMAASLGAQIDIPLVVVVKSQRNPFVTEWLNNARTLWKNKVVPLGASIRQIYKELQEKNIVAMVADQRGPSDGIRVNFFGRKVSVYPGPVMLSLKLGSPILYGIALRQPDFSYKSLFYEVSRENLPESEDEKIIELSQRHTSYLEQVMRKHPEQWLWMHKRWKY